jgi:predicted AAA+ superfamily ATPase
MLPRHAAPQLLDLARWYPVVAVTGPRQSGKTTLVRSVFDDKPYVSLEDPDVRDAALADPRGFLALYPNGAMLDEAQHAPSLFSYLQTWVDEDRHRGQTPGAWVLTGSQHFGLVASITQSLAGRVGLLHLLPLSLGELQGGDHPAAAAPLAELLWRGLYPPVVDRGIPPAAWYADYVATYVGRDLRQLLNVRDLAPFRTFMRMCAARSGQVVHLSALAADCGTAANTAEAWLSILQASYIVYTLPQHHVNFGKRLVKHPSSTSTKAASRPGSPGCVQPMSWRCRRCAGRRSRPRPSARC